MITVLAKKKSDDAPGYLVQSWFRESNTIRFLQCWELRNNPAFHNDRCETLVEEMRSPSLTLTAKKWCDVTGAIGLQSKQGKNGGTYAHPEIACAFRAWLYPEFQYEVIKRYMSTVSDEEFKRI